MQVNELEYDLIHLLGDLSTIQGELLDVLTAKRAQVASGDLKSLPGIQTRERELCERLQECHDRRAALLKTAADSGLQADSIRELSAALPNANRFEILKQAEATSSRMRLIQHHSLTNWVLAQRSLIHVSQLLEIIATGGQIKPTYGSVQTVHGRGSLVDQEA